MKIIIAGLVAAVLSVSSSAAPPAQNPSLLQKAQQNYVTAQRLENELNEKPQSERTRTEHLKVINAYQRVYLVTPHTPYADDSLIAIARLYQEINDNANAIKTLRFLLRDYPRTPFREAAEKDLARLNGAGEKEVVRAANVAAEGDSARPNAVTGLKTVSVDQLRYWEAPNSIRVVVDVGGEVKFTQGDAKSPNRFYVDLEPAKLTAALAGKQWPIKSGVLQQIRVGQYDASTVRIVLEVGKIASISTFTLRDPDRLIIDVLGKETVSPPSLPVTTSTTPTVPPSVESVSKPAPTVKKTADTDTKAITPAKETNAGTRSLVRSLGLKLSRVVIDAGHGGHDTGTIGPGGYSEKELVLDVAKRLKDLIEAELGAEVVMTRTDDTFVPLESRTVMANQQQADLFLSIHANSSRVRSVRGVETYFLDFTSTEEGLETASRENAASERSIHELQDLVKKIMLRDKVDESRELAQHIDRALAARKGSGMDRGVKRAPFVVLIGANMPSILAEICFISNPQDEKLVRAPETRQSIAESLFEGVRSYAESLSGAKTAKTQDKIQE
jgi:N-acetylmuramoyl-L-alanine amidase